MNPLFTIHAGEFVFGEYVEKKYKDLKLWIPTKDKGVDFLVTSKGHQKAVAVQVKMSRDYLPQLAKTEFEKNLVAGGWFVFSHKTLEQSPADIWSIVLISHERKSKPTFINISPKELLSRLADVHGVRKNYHIYPWLFISGDDRKCIEGRGMNKHDKEAFAQGHFLLGSRDISQFHENWDFLSSLK